jgi:site-specific DNA recombinase
VNANLAYVKPPGTILRAAVYVRISSDRTGDELGVTRQREDCEALINARGWTLAAPPFIENDTSAAGRKPRPQFRALLDTVNAGKVDVVVAWALDRLARTARDRLALVEECRDAGVIIALVRGSDMDPTTPAGRLTLGVLGEVAQHEIDQKSERQARAAEQAAENGEWRGGRRAFGYADDGVTIVPSEAAAVREGYAALLAGASLRGIAQQWNTAGFRTGQAPWRHIDRGERSPWRPDSVRRLLTNPRYAAIRAHRGVEIAPALWPAVVTEQTYRAALAVLADPARRKAGAAPRQLLTGLAFCALDGCGLLVHGGGASHRKPIYRCRTSTLLPDDRPAVTGTHVNRLAEPVDEFVGAVVVERLARPDARDLLLDHKRPDVAALRDEANALRSRLDGLAAEFGAKLAGPGGAGIKPGEYRTMRAPVVARLGEIEQMMADAGRVDSLGPLVAAADVAAVWADLPLERRRAVVDALMVVWLQAVGRGVRTFRPSTVEIVWRDPDS